MILFYFSIFRSYNNILALLYRVLCAYINIVKPNSVKENYILATNIFLCSEIQETVLSCIIIIDDDDDDDEDDDDDVLFSFSLFKHEAISLLLPR